MTCALLFRRRNEKRERERERERETEREPVSEISKEIIVVMHRANKKMKQRNESLSISINGNFNVFCETMNDDKTEKKR